MSVKNPLEAFLSCPTVAEADTLFSTPKPVKPWDSKFRYDLWKLRERFDSLLEEVFKSGMLTSEMRDAFLRLARKHVRDMHIYFSTKDAPEVFCIYHAYYETEPELQLQAYRLQALISHPVFMGDEIAADIIRMTIKCMVCRSTYWYQGSDEKRSIDPRFGEAQLATLHKVILMEDLWTHFEPRGIFSSVAVVLRLMAARDMLVQTTPARMDLLERLGVYGPHDHSPWCRGAFRAEEIDKLHALAVNDSTLRASLDRIRSSKEMLFRDHMC